MITVNMPNDKEEGKDQLTEKKLNVMLCVADEEMKPSVPAAGACAVTAFIQKTADGSRWL